MCYVTQFGVSTNGLVLFKNRYLNEDIIADNTAAAELINFLPRAISFTFSLRQTCQMHLASFFFTVANTACFKNKG